MPRFQLSSCPFALQRCPPTNFIPFFGGNLRICPRINIIRKHDIHYFRFAPKCSDNESVAGDATAQLYFFQPTLFLTLLGRDRKDYWSDGVRSPPTSPALIFTRGCQRRGTGGSCHVFLPSSSQGWLFAGVKMVSWFEASDVLLVAWCPFCCTVITDCAMKNEPDTPVKGSYAPKMHRVSPRMPVAAKDEPKNHLLSWFVPEGTQELFQHSKSQPKRRLPFVLTQQQMTPIHVDPTLDNQRLTEKPSELFSKATTFMEWQVSWFRSNQEFGELLTTCTSSHAERDSSR